MILIDTNNTIMLYTIKDVSKILNISEITVKRLIKENKILSIKISGLRRIKEDDLEEYIKTSQIEEIYKKLNEHIKTKITTEFKNLVNFSTNIKKPIHGWFNVKEGYSEELVSRLIKKFNIKKGIIIDPFNGSGTSMIAGLENDLNVIGFEINPFLAFLAKTKIIAKEDKKIKFHLEEIEKIKNKKIKKIPDLSIINKLFHKNLNKIMLTLDYIDNIENENIKNFLKLSLLSSLEDSSSAKKDGNGLKYPKNKKIKDFKLVFKNQTLKMLNDLKNRQSEKKEKAVLFNIDSRLINNYLKHKTTLKDKDIINKKSINYIKEIKGKVDMAIFSPPYMNCFDYTEVYKVELWMGGFVKKYEDLKKIRADSLSSHLNKIYSENENNLNRSYIKLFIKLLLEKKLWSNKIPLMIESYFHDMKEVMEGMFSLLKNKGKCIIVVGNSSYGSIAIPTDQILCKIAEEIGFKKIEINIARALGTSSQQYKTINKPELLRESIIILTK